MEGIDIQGIVRQAVKEYVREADRELAVREAKVRERERAVELARKVLERALAEIGE